MKSTSFFSEVIQRKYLDKVNTLIIGAGASGLSAATTLKDNGKKVLILEKESIVGGKCHTFFDPQNKLNKTEWGAMLLAPNYGKLIDKIREKKVTCEAILPCDISTMPLTIGVKKMNWLQKTNFGTKFSKQMLIFGKHA